MCAETPARGAGSAPGNEGGPARAVTAAVNDALMPAGARTTVVTVALLVGDQQDTAGSALA